MPSTAGTVMTRAAAHLNDASQLVYTSTVLLPFLNMALDELEEELAVYELSPLKKDSVVINVAINDTFLTSMPTDFVEAISLIERPQGVTDSRYVEVKEVADLDNNLSVNKMDSIVQWTARNAQVLINPPTSAREVILEFMRGLTTAASAGTAIDIETSRNFLALVTARNAARDLGNSISKAESLEKYITLSRDRVIRRLQKGNQSISGVRRKPYTGRSS